MEGHVPADTRPDTAFIFAGGEGPAIEPHEIAGRRALVVAADSGLDHAQRAGVVPDLVIGDMDSVTQPSLERAAADGADVVRHPVDKDATDLELALQAALARGARRVVIVGGGGGRLSHLLGNAGVLATVASHDVEVEWWLDSARVLVAAPGRPANLAGRPGDLVSLVALLPASGVTTRGLEWTLDDEPLDVGTTRGISNRLSAGTATVTVGSGVVLVISEEEHT